HDAMADPRVDAEVCRNLGIRSVAAVPLRGPRRVAGILEAFSSRPNAFDGDALTSLRDLAEIAETAYRPEVPAPTPAPAAAPQPQFTRPDPIAQSTLSPKAAAVAEPKAPQDFSQPNQNRVKWIVGIAAALLLTVAVAWWAWHTPGDEASSGTTQNVRAATPEPAVSTPAIQVIPKPAPGVGSSHSEPSPGGILPNPAPSQPL